MDAKNNVRCWACKRASSQIHYVIQKLALELEGRELPDYSSVPEQDQKMYEKAVHQARYHEMTPEGAHEFWMESMRASGWIHGVEKNNLLKTHPCMVPYSELSEYEKAKDVIFVTMARLLA